MIEIKDGVAEVTISGTFNAEQIRHLLRELGNAHGQLTNVHTPDTKLARFLSDGIDIRPIGPLVQISLLGPCGWVQHGLTHAQVGVLLVQVEDAMKGAPDRGSIQ